MTLFAPPAPLALRRGEQIVWHGKPCWRTMASRVFHIGSVAIYLCLLIFANAGAARMQHLPAAEALRGELPVLILATATLLATALLAWATAHTTVYTVTNQRVVLQYGIAIAATMALPMRLVAGVAVSDRAAGDIAIRLMPGQRVAFVKLWPHARPWRLTTPEPMLRALPGAAAAAALIARTVSDAQEAMRPADPVRVTRLAVAADVGMTRA